jgi:hypothetical protein
MNLRKATLRALKWTCVSVLALVLLLALLVQGQQWLLRWRAERLMADMHQIRLYQSTWDNAQRLMHKWGRWGHYDGTCTAESCRYAITLGNSFFGVNDTEEPNWFDRPWLILVGSGVFGTRAAALQTTFTVHKGSIWWMSVYFLVDVPSGKVGGYDGEYGLLVKAQSVQVMPGNRTNLTEQMEEHPYYYASRPSGCTNCMKADVWYSTRAPAEQIAQLTDLNFDCITRFRPCRFLRDVLPLEREWNLYQGFEPDSHPVFEKPQVPRPCMVPVWATARDSEAAVVAEVLGKGTDPGESDWYGPREKDRVRIVETLKGQSPVQVGSAIDVIPFTEDPNNSEPSEHMRPGERYVLLFDRGADDLPLPLIGLERCGVRPDTPETRREVAKGMAMNDDLRGPEMW